MSRPHYETDEDRQLEEDIAQRFASNFNRKQHALPVNSRIDRAVFDQHGTLTGFFEVKRRHYECGHFNTFFISLEKFKAMRWVGQTLKLPVMLVVQYDDLIAWIDITKLGGVAVRDGGREDRKDPSDIEKVVHIPIDRFHFITEEGSP